MNGQRHWLEHRIPPPIVTLAFGAAAYGIARLTPGLRIEFPGRVAGGALFALLGFAVAAAGMIRFRQAGTTVNPIAPSNASSVVTSGIYSVTRNPMYVGLVLVLVGFVTWLANPLGVLFVAGLGAYLHRFQIEPEERLLVAKFGDEYAAYLKSVRRWI